MAFLSLKLPSKYFWLVIILLFLIAGIFYALAWSDAPVMEPDSQTYMKLAQDLQDFHIDHLHGRTPGYPLLVLLTGSAETPQRGLFYVQLILYFITVGVCVCLLRRFGVSQAWVLFFCTLSLLPYNTVHTAYLLTESLTQVLVIGGLAATVLWLEKGRWHYLLLAGFTLGFSAIVKPTYQLLSVLVIAILFLFYPFFPEMRRRIVAATVSLAVFAVLLIGGMILYNAQNLDFTGLTPDFGFYLSTKTPRVLERLPEEYAAVREILIRYRDRLMLSNDYSHTGYMYFWSAVPEVQQLTGLKYPQLGAYMLKLNLTLIYLAPLTYLQEVTYSLSNLLLPATTMLSDFSSRTWQFVWTALHYLTVLAFILQCVFFAAIAIFFGSAPRRARARLMERLSPSGRIQFIFIVLALAAIYYTILISAMSDMGVARHRVPVDPLIFLIIVLGGSLWGQLSRWLKNILPPDLS